MAGVRSGPAGRVAVVVGIALGAMVLDLAIAGSSATLSASGRVDAPVAAFAGVGHRDAVSPAIRSQAESLLAAHKSSADEPSRSAERPALPHIERTTKRAALPVNAQILSGSRILSVPPAGPKEIALSLLPSYGWNRGEFSCLDAMWTRESNWDPHAANATSGAYGIPQALPGAKMSSYGSDWATNPETQIKWGLAYIRGSYGSPCGAWYFWESHGWY